MMSPFFAKKGRPFMNKKISLGLCISLIIISITATFAVTMVASKQIYNGIISGISHRSQTYESLDEISSLIENNYYFSSAEDRNRINAALVEGYVEGLGDPKSVYFDAEEYAEYTSVIDGGLTGIGVETAYDYQKSSFIITQVYEGSPAEKAGLKALDVITAIDNQTVTMGNYIQLSDKLYGAMLTTVQVEYMRDGETKVVEPMRGFVIPSVTGRLERNVGYIKISGFYKNTASEFEETAEKLIDQGAESLIFDVRNTNSGTIEYAAQVIDVVVPAIDGKIASIKEKSGKEQVFSSKTGGITMPFIVLVNSSTSGPAELFACDLRDISRAQIVGTKTAGVGTVQKIFTLENGGAVLLTTAIVEPNAGEAAIYNGTGIIPTTEVVLTAGYTVSLSLLTVEEDSQLSTALNMLAA